MSNDQNIKIIEDQRTLIKELKYDNKRLKEEIKELKIALGQLQNMDFKNKIKTK